MVGLIKKVHKIGALILISAISTMVIGGCTMGDAGVTESVLSEIGKKYEREFSVVWKGHEPSAKRDLFYLSPSDDMSWAFAVTFEKDGTEIKDWYKSGIVEHALNLEIEKGLSSAGFNAKAISMFYGIAGAPDIVIDTVGEYLSLVQKVEHISLTIILDGDTNLTGSADDLLLSLEEVAGKYNVPIYATIIIVASDSYSDYSAKTKWDARFSATVIKKEDVVFEGVIQIENGTCIFGKEELFRALRSVI